MSKIFKNMLPYWKSILVILMLLFVQAWCDLSLPSYTSDIIDVGIQNSGVEHVTPKRITEEEFQRIVKYMKRKAGINLSAKRVLIQGRLDNYLQKEGYHSYSEFMGVVEAFPAGVQAEYLLNALTTNHTYFWREYEQFLYLKETVFPKLAQKTASTKDWHIWCAASSTGEEPYTLAMLCMDYLGLEHSNWDTKILATDIDTHVLETARRGIYAKDSVEQLPATYVRRFFRKYNDKEYQVTKELKDEVLLSLIHI